MNASLWAFVRASRGPLVLITLGILFALDHNDVITFGRTCRPFTSQPHSRSIAVSYSPTSVPSGPLIRCSSSWMIRSGGRSSVCSMVFTAGYCGPSAGCDRACSISGDIKP